MEVAEFHGRVMASTFHVIAHSASVGEKILVDTIHEVVSYVEHLEHCWSRFLITSDVSRINQLGVSGGEIRVDPSTLTLLSYMVEGFQRTAGRFDPTVVRALIDAGYMTSIEDPARVSVVSSDRVPSTSILDLEIDPSTNTVFIPGGLAVDPGGIGKGLAADLAVAHLLSAGLDGAMVEIGGDLSMGGRSIDTAGWLVDVEHCNPDDGLLCSLAISGGGVATSSRRSRRWVHNGLDRHHQIDPRTEKCSTSDLTAVTVIAPTGWLAEIHATAALATGSEAVISYLEGHGLSGIAVSETSDGERVWRTPDLESILLNEVGAVQ